MSSSSNSAPNDWNNTTTFQLYALGANDGGGGGGGIARETTDADAVFYVKISDMLSVFKFRSSAAEAAATAIFDASSEIQYYVFRNCWPSALKINPAVPWPFYLYFQYLCNQ